MKKLTLLATGLLVAALASSASAQTLIKVTGSTAFRKGAVAGILKAMNTPTQTATAAYIGSGLDTANQAVITGTIGGNPVTFQLAWGGSLGGLQMITGQAANSSTTVPGAGFDKDHTWLTTASTTGGPGGGLQPATVTNSGFAYTITNNSGAISTAAYSPAHIADAAFSDTFQSTTKWNGGSQIFEVQAGNLGVIPFVWVKGPESADVHAASSGAWGRLTNISQQIAKELMTDGVVDLALITGNSADSGVDVIFVGRNDDSGTRFVTAAEAAFSQANTPTQFNLTTSGTNLTAITTPYAGYSSGGTMTTAVNATPVGGLQSPNGRPFIVVSYAGVSDAKNVNTGQNCLTYNGVGVSTITVSGTVDIFTTGLANLIQQGQYSFWSYEHLYTRGAAQIGTIQQNTLNTLGAQIATVDALAAGILTSTLQCGRSDENSPIFSNY